MSTFALLTTGIAGCLAYNLHAAAVPLVVGESGGVPRRAWPVTSGVPLAQGALTNASNVELLQPGGERVALQTQALARCPDGSVRWLLRDLQTDLAAGEKRAFTLQTGGPAVPASLSPLVRTNSGGVTIQTGPLRMDLNRAVFDPFGAVWLDRNKDGRFTAEERMTGAGEGFLLRDARSRVLTSASAPADIVVEEAGPLRVCVRVTGRHAGAEGELCSYVARIHAYRGQPLVRCDYTFIADHQDALMASIKEMSLSARLASGIGPATRHWLDGRLDGVGRVFQVDERGYRRDGEPGGVRAAGWAAGWAATAANAGGVALGLREFWQQWPKSLATAPGRVTLEICPEFPAGLYDGKPLMEEVKLYYPLRGGLHTFKAGMAKTHEIWAVFFAGEAEASELGRFFQAAEAPLLAVCDPAYVCSTEAAGRFPPADAARYGGYDAWFERALAGHSKRRDQEREYGMLNYGDWFGERRVNWGNLEYDLAAGLFQQYLRTGRRAYFDRAAQAARHHVDVDVVHALNPDLKNPWGTPPRVGEIWLHSVGHTGGYFTNAPLDVASYYQTGHSANFGHYWLSGDLLYSYLTGDRRAREVALRVADTMAESAARKVGTHIRDIGWPTILLLAAYEATNDVRYLEAVGRNWESLKQSLDWQRGWVVRLNSDHCLHPPGSTTAERESKYQEQRCEGNVPFMLGLTLSALARYHRHTGDPEVLRAITVGLDQMVRECWLEEEETFRYTACPLSGTWPGSILLSVEAMAYEARLTGNAERRRVLREGFASTFANPSAGGFDKGFGQMILFTPFALEALGP